MKMILKFHKFCKKTNKFYKNYNQNSDKIILKKHKN